MMLTRIYIVRDAFVTQDEITIFKEMLHEFTDEDWEYEVTEWKGSGFRPTFFGIALGIFDGVFHIGSNDFELLFIATRPGGPLNIIVSSN